MGKKQTIIIAALFMLLATAGAYLLLFKNVKQNSDTVRSAAKSPEKIIATGTVLSENDIYAQALSVSDRSVCRTNEKSEKVDACLMGFALEKADIGACAEIKEKSMAQDCVSLVQFNEFSVQKDPSKCLEIESETYRWSCAIAVAEAQNFKRKDCEKFSKDIKEACLLNAEAQELKGIKDPGVCGRYESESEKELCLGIVADNKSR